MTAHNGDNRDQSRTSGIAKGVQMFIRSLAATLFIAFVALAANAPPLYAQGKTIPFDGSWKEQGLLRLFSNEYGLQGRRLDVISDGTVSVLWRPVSAALGTAKAAMWEWSVTQGVKGTDLTRRGGDDRNLALYFIFVDPQTASTLGRTTARKLLRDPNTRALVYVWGGNHAKGALLNSPYSTGLKSKILQTAQTGNFTENVNLDRDFVRAFGDMPKVLVGLAVTADSDDTDGKILAAIQDLQIR
ncbi:MULTISPECIES: DUF3047 domain-containing protein [Sulfitobacter]|nr:MULTISPECIES: DUF3047 domain-containing protein [Sulfitobacter]WCE68704.1 DUF3047 domain-containing protein [Sulfitobacter faviae]|tara:strand:+ start:32211 stop:32942 length:732 start_codon:yes stop_codon:yes gene_type:complete